MYSVLSTKEYLNWFTEQNSKVQGQISARLQRIIEFGHFGDARCLGKRLTELK